MSWLLAFLGFAALIILHELGHFAAAKAVGMRVERFSLFFPPLLARVKRGETEYAVGAVPLGGYVKITGMNPNEEIPEEIAHRAYYRQKVWKRVFVILAGPVVNIVLAFLILWGIFVINGVEHPRLGVANVQSTGAAAGQLQPGDRILSVDGRPGYEAGLSPEQSAARAEGLREQINAHPCAGGAREAGCAAASPARVVVERDGQRRTLEIRPRYDEQNRRMLLGFGFETGATTLGGGEAASRSVEGMWRVTTLTVDRLGRLFFDSQARSEVSGVVGSYEATRQSFEFDTVRALYILALISLSLGIINLFPFLPLDGGHIFWAVAEKVRGRAIPFSVLERVSVVGFMLVILLFFIGLQNDIGRLSSGEGFGVR
jgi:regulator of sigma E protease